MAELARTTGIENLPTLSRMSGALRERAAAVGHISRARLVQPAVGAGVLDLPASTDWSHRPSPWSGPITPTGFAPAKSETAIGEGVNLFHDCKSPELSVRQVQNRQENDLAPFGLQFDIFDFDGSFLSLVFQTPQPALAGIGKNYVLRLGVRAECERALGISARLNLKHGPNTAQVRKEFPPGEDAVEFDLSYIPFNALRVDQIWFDLFFDAPAMNQILIRDVTLSRHLRAAI